VSKVCKVCGLEKPIEDFRPQRCICKACYNIEARLKRKNMLCVVPSAKVCSKCGILKPAEDFHKANSSPTGLQAQCKECKAEVVGTRNEYLREYYLLNKDRLNAYGREYQKTDKGKAVARTTKHARRAGLKNNSVTGDKILWLVARQPLCFWCGKAHNGVYQVDHFIPLSKGGVHEISNLVIACPKCNNRKSAKFPEHFAIEIGKSTTKLYEEDFHEW